MQLLRTVMIGLMVVGAACIGVGWAWHWWFPYNKALWTSSYVLFMTGLALQTLKPGCPEAAITEKPVYKHYAALTFCERIWRKVVVNSIGAKRLAPAEHQWRSHDLTRPGA